MHKGLIASKAALLLKYIKSVIKTNAEALLSL